MSNIDCLSATNNYFFTVEASLGQRLPQCLKRELATSWLRTADPSDVDASSSRCGATLPCTCRLSSSTRGLAGHPVLNSEAAASHKLRYDLLDCIVMTVFLDGRDLQLTAEVALLESRWCERGKAERGLRSPGVDEFR